MPPPPDLGKLTCPKCQKDAKRHCGDDPQTKRPVSSNCDLVVCDTCGYGSKDGHLWHKGQMTAVLVVLLAALVVLSQFEWVAATPQ